ncbi:MAG: hypothetical protein LBS59_07750 [Puniceicoccales bacterium]|jgi:pullulanase/glycogen debranching enzyme|nr:hypothetical protein [Puniceicoccales bacterium]
MENASTRLLSAYWTTRFTGIVELSHDWTDAAPPPLALAPPARASRIFRMEARSWARLSGYYFEDKSLVFLLWRELYPHIDFYEEDVCVAGNFNDWTPQNDFVLHPETIKGETALVLRMDADEKFTSACEFKFVTHGGTWLEPLEQAPNICRDTQGNRNLHIDPARTGYHAFGFVSETPARLAAHDTLLLLNSSATPQHAITIAHGDFLFHQDSTLETGVHVEDGKTRFRLFAPRANNVTIEFWSPHSNKTRSRHQLSALGDGVWEVEIKRNLHGWYYHYFIDGENDTTAAFDPTAPVLDPCALAAAAPSGPGLVIDLARISRPLSRHTPPAPTDAIIIEAHLRDLLTHAVPDGHKSGFRELATWLRSPECYLRKLGANVLELQPIQEVETPDRDTYQWGYMPVNWFAPASLYASDPASGSQFGDMQDFVSACHEAGISLILDVVYNHSGSPNHLLRIDKSYYFETARDGSLSNWSGCGNDLRTAAPMLRRLILNSLRHLVEFYDIDGFRFDLAELLGTPLLRQIERELRPLKPGLLLIAEPWSFRGHIGRALTRTSLTAWNDAFRDFLPAYLHNTAPADGLRYFMSGSPASPEAEPFHSLNYTESHDDFCWIDRITENPDNNGANPTENDARRSRLMAATLLASLGVPMFSAGQDFLRSKHGSQNTYRNGTINALDYSRIERFRKTHDYFQNWIAFRLSAAGATLRLRSRPRKGFFRFFNAPQTNALGSLYNADGRFPAPPLFFAINPSPSPVSLPVPGVDPGGFRQVADADSFCPTGLPRETCFPWRAGLLNLPALCVGLWIAD